MDDERGGGLSRKMNTDNCGCCEASRRIWKGCHGIAAGILMAWIAAWTLGSHLTEYGSCASFCNGIGFGRRSGSFFSLLRGELGDTKFRPISHIDKNSVI